MVSYSKDTLIEMALDCPSVERAMVGLVYGGITGLVAGVVGGAYLGFEVGETINDNLEIMAFYARHGIDALSMLTGAAIGTLSSTIAGGITGLVGGGVVGTIEEKLSPYEYDVKKRIKSMERESRNRSRIARA